MSCEFNNNEEVIKKIYEKGFENDKMPVVHEIKCECGQNLLMENYIVKCTSCNNIFGVTPCNAEDINNVVMVKN